MKDFPFWLDQAKANIEIEQDKELAMILGISTSLISHYRNGRLPTTKVCYQVADLADADPAEVWLSVELARTSDEKAKAMIEQIAKRLGGVSAAIMAAVLVGLSSMPSAAYAAAANSSSYTLSRPERRRWRRD